MSELDPALIKPYIFPLNKVGVNDRLFVGGKAAHLGEMIQSGIPVPEGYAVTTAAFNYFIKNGCLPEGLLDGLSQVRQELGGAIALRSSATVEDMGNLSMAGVFRTHYVHEEDDLLASILDVYSNARSGEVLEVAALHNIDPADIKMGLVAQRLIKPDFAGVVYTQVNGDQYLVEYTSGFGSSLVDGEVLGNSLLTDNLGQVLVATQAVREATFDELTQKLVRLSSQIEGIFGGNKQDIEFAIQKEQLYILQARSLSRELGQVTVEESVEQTLENTKSRLRFLTAQEKALLGTQRVTFIDSNISELLPHPTEMDVGIFTYIFSGSDGIAGAMQLGRRELGYQFGDESIGFVYFIGGRPLLSFTKHALNHYAGFPDSIEEYTQTLVGEYLMAVEEDPRKGCYPEMGLFLQDPTYDDLSKRYGEQQAARFFQTYLAFSDNLAREAEESPLRELNNPDVQRVRYEEVLAEMESAMLTDGSNQELVDYILKILEHLRTQSGVDFVKVARLGFYYSQKLLLELKRKFSSQETEVIFGKLLSVLLDTKVTTTNYEVANLPENQVYDYAHTHLGHFAQKEILEIHNPRFKDDSAGLTAYVDGLRSSNYLEDQNQRLTERQKLEEELLASLPDQERQPFKTLITNAQNYMSLRETIKYYFTKEYMLVRDAEEILQSRLGLKEGDIYFVYPRELAQLIEDPSRFAPLIHFRKLSFNNYPLLDLPQVIREKDVDNIGLKDQDKKEFIQAQGKFLSEGQQFVGMVVNLDEFEDTAVVLEQINRAKKSGIKIVLAAQQINLTHDPLIALADGMIIQNASITSHGAQRAREMGTGALSGIRSRDLQTGILVDFDPMNKVVKKVEQL